RRALALAAPLAQLVLGAARALLGQQAIVLGQAQLVLDRAELRRDAAGARLFVSEERLEIAELALEREDAGRGALGLAADEERAAARAALAQTRDGIRRGLRVVDHDGFRHLAQQRVERGLEALGGAHPFRRRGRVRNQLESGAAHLLVLRLERGEQRAQRVDLVRRLRDLVARRGQR